MTKRLHVSSEIQRAIFDTIIRPELTGGFWMSHRPANHGQKWEGVEVVVSDSNFLGFEEFEAPRLYNLVNPKFLKPNAQRVLACAQQVKPSATLKSVQKELLELSHILAKRLTDKNMQPGKTYKKAPKIVPARPADGARTAIKRK
jgi:hypothetical protein